METVTYKGLTFQPYITSETIQQRINELGKQIGSEYAGKCPLILCVLTGAFPFASDLFRAIGIDAEIAFIRLKSYEGTSTTGKVKQVIGRTRWTRHNSSGRYCRHGPYHQQPAERSACQKSGIGQSSYPPLQARVRAMWSGTRLRRIRDPDKIHHRIWAGS